jgi:hypothetical protein
MSDPSWRPALKSSTRAFSRFSIRVVDDLEHVIHCKLARKPTWGFLRTYRARLMLKLESSVVFAMTLCLIAETRASSHPNRLKDLLALVPRFWYFSRRDSWKNLAPLRHRRKSNAEPVPNSRRQSRQPWPRWIKLSVFSSSRPWSFSLIVILISSTTRRRLATSPCQQNWTFLCPNENIPSYETFAKSWGNSRHLR